MGRAERMHWGQFSVSHLANNFMISTIAKDDLLPFSNCRFGVSSHHNSFSTFKQVDCFCFCFSYTHFFKRTYVATIINWRQVSLAIKKYL